ncbi:hypothetical protein IMSHALPRED_005584 [Imshaugia aleurites]|uniref:Jacalin-type lectin domain-containing protein n=1 Tax=Imshaugia aleurites TaxID=172621 RepID=A0A8H3ELV1_9LECA|nr:hypothetical protein IMSHALPRED_005584 [Imshaugia aleurites]
MPFFKEFRRKKTSSKTEQSLDSSNDSNGSNGTNGAVPTTKSSSTINSVYASSTPPSSIQPHQSTPNLVTSKSTGAMTPLPQRPVPLTSVSNRSSFMGMNTPSINGTITPKMPTSSFAPRVLSVSDNSWVHQKVLLVYGQIGDPSEKTLDGTLTVCHHQDSFPATLWPVSDSHFKALVHLNPGPNRLRFDFMSPKVASINPSLPAHSSWINVNFLPLINSPPLQLVILLGKDSPATFDAVPERKQREGNDLDIAIRKFRMAAYLWQAFTGEQMYRNGFGRRCFRFEEEWQTGSLTFRDKEMGQMRNEAKVHVVRTEKTVKELRDLDLAQQYENATHKGELYSIAMEAVKEHFRPVKGQRQYISLLLLDAHWDTKAKTITGHAALGGGAGEVQLAIFGSQALQSYPASIEEVVPAFSDCTRTNTNFVANDCNESGSNWEAANIGIGAHLHETGHLFGCPHQESGIMLRDYVRLNRTFLCREPYSTRTKSPGVRLCLPKDECGWHRLDALRFKYHPCFRLPTDAPLNPDESIQVWPADNGKALITAPTGVSFVEIFTEGDETCRAWLEYSNGDVHSGGPPKQIVLTENDLKARLPESKKSSKKLRVKIHSAGQGSYEVVDFNALLKSKTHMVKLPNGQSGFKGCKLGESGQEGSQPEQIILETAHIQTKLLTSIKVYHGFALDGLEFLYEDSTSQMFGKRGGQPGGSEFMFDTRRGEILLGFYLRAGLWIDGIEILTSLGRRSGVFGNSNAGSGFVCPLPNLAEASRLIDPL